MAAPQRVGALSRYTRAKTTQMGRGVPVRPAIQGLQSPLRLEERRIE